MSYIPEDDEENDSGNHMMPTISEAILNVFMISLGNFGDIWDALAATNHQTIGEVKTLYKGTSINDVPRFLAIFDLPTSSCGRVVRDFESKAKTRWNFQFRY